MAFKAKKQKIMEKEEKSLFFIIEFDVLFDNRLKDKEKILYSVICYYANNKKGYCFKTNKQLIQIINVKERYFYKLINSLVEKRYIEVIKTKQRSYLMPVVNRIYLEAAKKRQEKHEEFMRKHPNGIPKYDWLNDQEI